MAHSPVAGRRSGECEFPKMRIGFARSDFGNDARIAR
jgi:hypothetical protein